MMLSLAFSIEEAENSQLKIENKKLENLKEIGLIDIYLINLDRRPERLKNMQYQLDYLQLPFTRIPAIDGKHIEQNISMKTNYNFSLHPETKLRFEWIEEAINDKRKNNENTYGNVGCWQSHLQTYFLIRDKAEKTNNDGLVLILEDDIVIEKRFLADVKKYLKLLPSDWDIFFLGSISGKCMEIITKKLCRGYDMWRASSYIINGSKTAKKLISMSNTMHIQISDHMWRDHFKKDLKAYIFTEAHLTQQDRKRFSSDVAESRIPPGYNLKDPIVPMSG